MASCHHLTHFRIFLRQLLYDPHQLRLLLEIVAWLRQHNDIAFIPHLLECLQRYGIHHTAVKHHPAIEFHRARHCRHGTRGSHPVELVVREFLHLVIHRFAGLYVSGYEPEVHRVFLERLAVERVYLKRHHVVGELRTNYVAGLYQAAQPHVAWILAQVYVVAQSTSFLP